MKPVRLSLALVGMALWLGCASVSKPPGGPLRCEARPYRSASKLVKVEITRPAVELPPQVQPVRPESMNCGKLSELFEPDPACAKPDGPVCAYVIHPTAGSGSSALPD